MPTPPEAPVVWLPHEEARALLGDLPANVRVEVWTGQGDPPPGDVHFLIPPFLGASASFEGLDGLQVIQLLSAGAETVVPHVPADVTLCTARGAHTASTSEWAAAAILASVRELPAFQDTARVHRWDRRNTGSLDGATVTIVGYGDIGAAVAARLLPFGVTIVPVTRTGREGTRSVAELPTLLPEADVVVLLLPLTDHSRGMVDAAFLARMKPGALLVNAARGAIVDTAALVAALHGRRITAALDVTDPEPLPSDHPLWDAPGLLLTPHVAGGTPGSDARAYGVARANLDRWLGGHPLVNVVTEAGY